MGKEMGFRPWGRPGKWAMRRWQWLAAGAAVSLALLAARALWHDQHLAPAYAFAGWRATLWAFGAGFVVPLFLGVGGTAVGERAWQQGFLRSLIDSASVGVAVIEGPDNRLEFANPVYQRILGGAPEAIVGRPLRDLLSTETAEIAEGYIAEAYRTGGPVRACALEETGEPARTSYWDVDYAPLRRDDGQPPAMLMLAMPVSERVRARREVEALAAQAQQRAAQLQAVLSAISDPVLVVDADQNPIFVNDRVARWLGGEPTPESLRWMGDFARQAELYWPNGTPLRPEERHLPRALQGEVIVDEEVMYRPPQGGSLRWARLSAAPVRERGRITGAVVTGSDITAQKQAQAERERLLAEVQSTRENLRAIIDRIPDGVMVVDTSQRVVMSNETTRRYLGHDAAGMGLPELRRIHEAVMTDGRPFPPGQTPVERALRGEAVAGLEMRMLHLDGHVIDALESAAPLRDAEGRITGAVVALADITARKEAEREREELLVEVQRARADLYTIVDRLPDWVLVLDATRHVTLISEALRRESGRDLVGMTIEEVWRTFDFGPADGRPFPPGQSPAERALRGETVLGVEIRAHMPGDTIRYAIENAAPLYDSDGHLYGAVVVQTDITTQKQAQAELQAARTHLQTVIDRLPDWVLVLDGEMRVTLANEAIRQQAGRELAGMTVEDLWDTYGFVQADGRPFPPGQSPGERAIRGETVTNVETRIRLPDGSLANALESAAPLYGPDGRVYGIVVVLTNITALRQAEAERERLLAEVQAAHENLRIIVDHLPDGVMVVDTSQRVVLSNETNRRYVGQDVTGMTLPQLRDVYGFAMPDGRPFPPGQAPIERALRGEAVGGVEARILRVDGYAVDALESAAPLYDGEGRLSGAVVALTDITALRQAEAEVRRAQQYLQMVVNRLPDGVAVIDSTQRVTLVNEASRRILGRDITGASLADLDQVFRVLSPEGKLLPSQERPVQRLQRGEPVSGTELRIERPDGGLVDLLVGATPLYDHGLTTAIVTMTDITARKEAERERERLLHEIQRARADLYTTLDRLPDWVLVLDSSLRVTLANAAIRRDAGREVVGMTAAELWSTYEFTDADGRPFPPGQTAAERALRGEVVTNVEGRVRRPERTIVSELESAAPLYDSEGRLYGVVVVLTDITARKQAEAERERLLGEVQAARRNLETVLDRLPDGVLVVDAALRITLANAGARQYLGSDIVGQPVGEVVRRVRFETADGRPLAEDQWPMQRAIRGEPVSGMEVRAVLPDGATLDLLASAVALRDGEGRVIGAVLAVTDITPQRRAQAERERLLAEVQEARRNLQTTLEWLPAGVVAVGLDLRVVLTNSMVRQYLGRDLAGMPISDAVREYGITTPDGQPYRVDEHSPVRRALEGEVFTNLEALAYLHDGRRRNVLASLAPMRGPDGAITGAVIAMLDVTVERQAEAERERLLAEVQTVRANLQAILNRLPDGVLVVDPSLHVTLCNDAIRARIGRDVTGEPVQRLWRELHFAAADGRPFPPGETPVERALRGEVVAGVEVSSQFPGEKRVDALDSAAALYNPDGSVREVAMVFTDITPLKELDRAKDQFISVAAHELRTPLTSLKGHAQILLRRSERMGWAESDRQSLHTIDGQVDRLNDLISRLLDVSRIRLGRLQLSRKPTDIVALTWQVAEEMQVTTHRHRITVQAGVPELVGDWDPAALRQVLTNLVGNAIRYADPGPIDLRVAREDGRAVVSVTDYGPGIPPERQAQLFEAFRPGAAEEYRKAGGLGLGLYISRGIVEAHGGRIWLESQVGVGTTFTFTLPLSGRRG